MRFAEWHTFENFHHRDENIRHLSHLSLLFLQSASSDLVYLRRVPQYDNFYVMPFREAGRIAVLHQL